MNTRSMTVVAAVAIAGAVLVGCSNDDNDGHSTGPMGPMTSMPMATPAPSGETSSDHNAADVMWTQMMIPHHRQAVEMAALAEGRTDNPQLLSLAARIEAAQNPEIEQMTGWLAAWGVPAMPGGTDHSMPGGMTVHDGMMSSEQMTALENSSGTEFDHAWLEMMIAHHQGAVDSSRQIQAEGVDEQVRALAGQIIAAQQAEIEQMRAMLQ
ncbi:DUF305 domain-containing protein [Rhodococcus sp. NPDC003318]|uniref:DUF305 domain-containing protein n=1 Tax=Rhodococcus sp. NPDC003318 TaxID=3364503 RepID=UPI0036A30553